MIKLNYIYKSFMHTWIITKGLLTDFHSCVKIIIMKILSLDLSTKSSGYAVFENDKLIKFGVIKSTDKDLLVRGNYMAEFVRILCEKYGKFDLVGIEELKVLRNQSTLVKLAQVQGMVLRELKDQVVKFVMPTMWRKGFELNGKRAEAKAKAIKLCEELGYKVECDDDAEAILLGIYFQKWLTSKQ